MRDVKKGSMNEFHKKIIEEHMKVRTDQNGDEKGDMSFVDILLSLPSEDGKEHMDDVETKALIQDMIAAATNTSAVTNKWAMTEVIKHPRVLRRIQEELDEVDNVEEFRSERHLVAAAGSGTEGRVEISHGADFKILSFSTDKRKCPGAPLGVAFVLTADEVVPLF
ncbi:hypothetical protein Scep_027535 [Stephania cephalantha]|uniref:Cytochrome P450 n=1 Tax=Stephania cephalantha TaxID=152367 RepID=A0AAP0HHC0_9MAGN